jgi:hypothetical protein
MSRCRMLFLGIMLGLAAPLYPRDGHAAAGAADAAEATVLAVQTEVRSAGSEASHPLAHGEVLRSGDRILLRVEVDHPVYVSVIAKEADGTLSLVYPPQGELRLDPGSVRTIPPDGGALELDDNAGEENLFVIASRAPLPRNAPDQYQRILAGKLAGNVSTAAEAPPPDRPPPMPIRTTDRGIKLVCAQKTGTLCVRSNSAGFAVAKLSFSHAPSKRRGPLPTNAR